MSIENDVYMDLRASLARSCPEIAAANVWETDHLDKIAWESLTPPYAVICIEEFPVTEEGSADSTNYLPTAELWYVMEVRGPLTSMRDKLSAIKDDLLGGAFADIEIWNAPSVAYGRTLQPNMVFADKRMLHQAGRVLAQCFIGTQY